MLSDNARNANTTSILFDIMTQLAVENSTPDADPDYIYSLVQKLYDLLGEADGVEGMQEVEIEEYYFKINYQITTSKQS